MSVLCFELLGSNAAITISPAMGWLTPNLSSSSSADIILLCTSTLDLGIRAYGGFPPSISPSPSGSSSFFDFFPCFFVESFPDDIDDCCLLLVFPLKRATETLTSSTAQMTPPSYFDFLVLVYPLPLLGKTCTSSPTVNLWACKSVDDLLHFFGIMSLSASLVAC